jgi:hypothetical protein
MNQIKTAGYGLTRLLWLTMFVAVLFFNAYGQTNPPKPLNKFFTVWLGSSPDVYLAEAEKGLYAQYKQPITIEPVNLGAQGVWYRTYIGKFSSREAAFEFAVELKKALNFESIKVIELETAQ